MNTLILYWNAVLAKSRMESDPAHVRHGGNPPGERAAFKRILSRFRQKMR